MRTTVKITILLLILATILMSNGLVFAGTVEIGRDVENKPINIIYDEEWSFKDFTGRVFTDIDPAKLEGKIIYASCFSQELPPDKIKGFVKVFPDSVQHITFVNCNLDNCKILKPGWVVMGGSERNFKCQKDANGKDDGDWEIDTEGIKIKKIE